MLKLHAERQDLGVAQVATLLEVDLLVGALAVGVTLPPFDVRWGHGRHLTQTRKSVPVTLLTCLTTYLLDYFVSGIVSALYPDSGWIHYCITVHPQTPSAVSDI